MENLQVMCAFLKLNVFFCLRDIFQVRLTISNIPASTPKTSLCKRAYMILLLSHIYLLSYSLMHHCVKGVRIRSYSSNIFPAFSRNLTEYGEIQSISLHIQSECGKTRENADQNNSEYGLFKRSACGLVKSF